MSTYFFAFAPGHPHLPEQTFQILRKPGVVAQGVAAMRARCSSPGVIPILLIANNLNSAMSLLCPIMKKPG
jgi:hypothetical protein